MRSQAAAAFYPEMLKLEAVKGPINWIYPDTTLKPTTGIGSLLGSKDALDRYALALPWRSPLGDYASESAIAQEWIALRGLGVIGDGYAYERHATLFLDALVVQWDFNKRVVAKEAVVSKLLPNWTSLTADAQLAAMSMAWNVGENMFNPAAGADYWPHLTAALKAEDYLTAAENCLINGRPSERNRRNRVLFTQAARTKQFGDNPETLFGTGVTLQASHLDGAKPDVKSSTGWWAQRMLGLVAFYTGPLDALSGPMSRAALAKYGKARHIAGTSTQPILTALAAETLQVTVTA